MGLEEFLTKESELITNYCQTLFVFSLFSHITNNIYDISDYDFGVQ